jgi:hypothetical protein
MGGLGLLGAPVRECTSVEGIVEAVRYWADEHPEAEWITGDGFDAWLAPGGRFDARRLDAAVPDRPVVLRTMDHHTAWVNTEALRRVGFTAATPDPDGGEIVRREGSTEPLGTLREFGAVLPVLDLVPQPSHDAQVEALRETAARFAASGVTWMQDAWVEPHHADVWITAATSGPGLPVRADLGFFLGPEHWRERIAGLAAERERVEGAAPGLLTAHTVKFFADGVIENETGALLAPYCGSLHDHGMQVWDNLAEAARAVDALGFQIHIHAIGDAAARQALDAIEHVVASNGPRDRRPVIAHAQLVDDADIDRFAALGVIPNMQPLWAQLDPLMVELTIPRLGADRGAQQYRMRSLDESGAPLAFGSDWPVSSGAPLKGIAVAVSRGGWTPQEIMSVERAMSAYTAGVARQAFAEGQWGTISPGVDADLVWLDRDPRSTPAPDLAAVRVVGTYLRGDRVYAGQ